MLTRVETLPVCWLFPKVIALTILHLFVNNEKLKKKFYSISIDIIQI